MTRLVCCLSLLVALAPADTAGAQTSSIPFAVRLEVDAYAGHAALDALYRPLTFNPLWLGAQGRPTDRAKEAIALLRHAENDGLDPADYDVVPLTHAATALSDPRAFGGVQQAARFEVSLSAAMLGFLKDLHEGRMGSRQPFATSGPPRQSPDYGERLHQAVSNLGVPDVANRLRPSGHQYTELAAWLSRYRSLAHRQSALADWQSGLTSKTVRLGDRTDVAQGLWDYLHELGDAPADPGPFSDVYDQRLADAVRHFQARHGLEPDGILGVRTRAALLVPLTWRVRQIELAMERVRWIVTEPDTRLITVVVPMYEALVWDTMPPLEAPALRSRVIVGTPRTPTPMVSALLTEATIRPFWNVPRSILLGEILPAFGKDSSYLREHDMELVSGPGDDSPVVDATPENIERLRRGELRLRQRPGPRNALGLIKFTFQNEHDVYMHDTPARALFNRARRDFSHGCIRVEDVVGLAQWIFEGDPLFGAADVRGAMDGGETFRVPVRRRTRVALLYATAWAGFGDGAIAFAEDVYGEDRRLDRALRARSRAPMAERLPGSDAAGIDVNEVRSSVEADATPARGERGVAQLRQRNVGEPDVDGLSLHVEAARRHALALLSQHRVGGGRPKARNHLERLIGARQRGHLVQ